MNRIDGDEQQAESHRKPCIIGIAIWANQEYGRRIASAVMDSVETDVDTRVKVLHIRADVHFELEFAVDGVIAVVEQNEYMRFEKLNVPVVYAPRIFVPSQATSIGCDGKQIGAEAAAYLAALQLGHFSIWTPVFRGDYTYLVRGFVDMIAERGGRLLPAPAASMGQPVIDWIESLPSPSGVFCVFDSQVRYVLNAAEECGRRVPDDIAVLAATNDPFQCLSLHPSVTAVVSPADRIAEQATEMIYAAIDGDTPQPRSAPPIGIAERQSTDMVALSDPIVAKAVRFIRQQFNRPITTDDVAHAVHISRRALEYRFKDAMNCGVHDELVRCRLTRAKVLLANTNLPIKQIAYAVGYPLKSNFNRFIKSNTGMSPTDFRNSAKSTIS